MCVRAPYIHWGEQQPSHFGMHGLPVPSSYSFDFHLATAITAWPVCCCLLSRTCINSAMQKKRRAWDREAWCQRGTAPSWLLAAGGVQLLLEKPLRLHLRTRTFLQRTSPARARAAAGGRARS